MPAPYTPVLALVASGGTVINNLTSGSVLLNFVWPQHDLLVLSLSFYQSIADIPEPFLPPTYQGYTGVRKKRVAGAGTLHDLYAIQVASKADHFVPGGFGVTALSLPLDPAYAGAVALSAHAWGFAGSRIGEPFGQIASLAATSNAPSLPLGGVDVGSIVCGSLAANWTVGTALPSTATAGTFLARGTYLGTGDVTNRIQRELSYRQGQGSATPTTLAWAMQASKAWLFAAWEVADRGPEPGIVQEYTRRDPVATAFTRRTEPPATPYARRDPLNTDYRTWKKYDGGPVRTTDGWGLDWGSRWGDPDGPGPGDDITTPYTRRTPPSTAYTRR